MRMNTRVHRNIDRKRMNTRDAQKHRKDEDEYKRCIETESGLDIMQEKHRSIDRMRMNTRDAQKHRQDEDEYKICIETQTG